MDDVTVTMLPTEELSPALRRSIIDVCKVAHDSELFEDLFIHFPSGARHFMAYLDAELVSHAVAATRWAQPDGRDALRTAYVDAVSTHPDHQGRGYGSAVMRALAAGVDDYDVACLQTDRPTFYDRLGWEVWRGPLAGREDDGTVTPTPEQRGVMVLRLATTPPLDLDTGLSIERQPYRFWE